MDQINYLPKSAEGAIQMLLWSLEEVQKTGDKVAEQHVRLALKRLLPPDEMAGDKPGHDAAELRRAKHSGHARLPSGMTAVPKPASPQ